MRDLSLHILDLLESSLRAGASLISVTVAEDRSRDALTVEVEDNSQRPRPAATEASDSSSASGSAEKTGFGLGLFKAAAEEAGGSMVTGKSRFGGAFTRAEMKMSRMARMPLGDLAGTLSSVVCTNPGVEVVCRLFVGARERVIKVSEVAKNLPETERYGLAVARRVSEAIKEALAVLRVRG